jgi:hypothetical protein
MTDTSSVITIVKPRWMSPVAAWLSEVRSAYGCRAQRTVAVPVEHAADQLGVRVAARPLSPTLWGVTWGAHDVTVNSRLRDHERRFALAHELAHVGQARGLLVDDYRSGEWQADWFARELLLPLDDLAKCRALRDTLHDRDGLRYIAQTWQVPETAVLLQAAWLGVTPEIWIHDGRVLCCRCGDRTPLAGCACVAYSGLTVPNRRLLTASASRASRQELPCPRSQSRGSER